MKDLKSFYKVNVMTSSSKIIDYLMLALTMVLCINILIMHANVDDRLFAGYAFIYYIVPLLSFLAYWSKNKLITIIVIILSVVFSIFFPQIKYYTYWWFEGDKAGHVYLLKLILKEGQVPYETYSSGYSLWPAQFIVFDTYYLVTGFSDLALVLKLYSIVYLTIFVIIIFLITYAKFGRNIGILVTIFSMLFFEIIKASIFMYNFYTLLFIYAIEIYYAYIVTINKQITKKHMIIPVLFSLASIMGTFTYTFVLFLILVIIALITRKKECLEFLVVFSILLISWTAFIAPYRAIPPILNVLKETMQLELTVQEKISIITHRPIYLFMGMISQIILIALVTLFGLIFVLYGFINQRRVREIVLFITKNPIYMGTIGIFVLFISYVFLYKCGMVPGYRVIIGGLPLVSMTISFLYRRIFMGNRNLSKKYRVYLLFFSIISATYAFMYFLSNDIRFSVNLYGYNPVVSIGEYYGMQHIYVMWDFSGLYTLASEGLLHCSSHIFIDPYTVNYIFGKQGGVHTSSSLYLFSRFFINRTIEKNTFYTLSYRMLKAFPYTVSSYNELNEARIQWIKHLDQTLANLSIVYNNGDLLLLF